MNENELRLGNYLLGYDNNYFTWDYGHYDLCSKGIDADELGMPIELTEEILLKCGFEFSHITGDERVFSNKKINLLINTYDNNIIKFNVFIIKHLHQLQNLYFALTGTELEIEL